MLFHKLFHEIHINTIINNFIILFHKTRSSSRYPYSLILFIITFSSKIFDNNCTIIYKINNLPKEIF